jgi:hypothetical protein
VRGLPAAAVDVSPLDVLEDTEWLEDIHATDGEVLAGTRLLRVERRVLRFV